MALFKLMIVPGLAGLAVAIGFDRFITGEPGWIKWLTFWALIFLVWFPFMLKPYIEKRYGKRAKR